jgi:tetratricopeptide (TPR) repeat protein
VHEVRVADRSKCPNCSSQDLRWSTLRKGVPVDVLRCAACNAVVAEEDWLAPLLPLQAGRCLNCGDRRERDVCLNCGLNSEEDRQVHDELRDMVAPTHDLINAARAATKDGRWLIGLKLASAASMLSPEERHRHKARALRIWLLSAIGEPEAALDDARAWVEAERDPPALAWASLGQQQQHAGHKGAAADSFGKTLAKDPDQVSIRARRAQLLMELSREGQAAEDACMVFESEVDERTLEIALAVAEKLCDKFEAAFRDDEVQRLLERAGLYVERSAALLAHRARLAALEGDDVTAKRELKKARKLDPELPLYERVERLIKPQRTSWWRW